MPKGQQRGNREAKKPKQPKKVTIPASPGLIPQAKWTPPPGKKR